MLHTAKHKWHAHGHHCQEESLHLHPPLRQDQRICSTSGQSHFSQFSELSASETSSDLYKQWWKHAEVFRRDSYIALLDGTCTHLPLCIALAYFLPKCWINFAWPCSAMQERVLNSSLLARKKGKQFRGSHIVEDLPLSAEAVCLWMNLITPRRSSPSTATGEQDARPHF